MINDPNLTGIPTTSTITLDLSGSITAPLSSSYFSGFKTSITTGAGLAIGLTKSVANRAIKLTTRATEIFLPLVGAALIGRYSPILGFASLLVYRLGNEYFVVSKDIKNPTVNDLKKANYELEVKIKQLISENQGGTPDDLDGTPDDLDGTPDDLDGTPGDLGGTPGDLGGTPGDLGGTPGDLGGTPGDLGGTPGDLGGTPGDLGGTPGDLGGTPAGGVAGNQDKPNLFDIDCFVTKVTPGNKRARKQGTQITITKKELKTPLNKRGGSLKPSRADPTKAGGKKVGNRTAKNKLLDELETLQREVGKLEQRTLRSGTK